MDLRRRRNGAVCGPTLLRVWGGDLWFFDQKADQFPNGLLGKPVILPERFIGEVEDSFVIIAAFRAYQEISNLLKKKGFPQERIHEMSRICLWFATNVNHKQYFEFPELYLKGTAFIDAGSYNCNTSLEFTKWSNGSYSKIFAFEPDSKNFKLCRENAKAWKIRDIELFQSGLSDTEQMVTFEAGMLSASHIVNMTDANDSGPYEEMIQTVTIDTIVKDEIIGFIKMDIEGSEYDALHGAKNTIQRDKPLLAISVYHRRGDMLAIMDYLHELVPEYRFWLRHYNIAGSETVLYASVKIFP